MAAIMCALGVILASAPVMATGEIPLGAQQVASPPARVLHFPPDRSVGAVYLLDPGNHEHLEGYSQWKGDFLGFTSDPISAHWVRLGPAKGDVRIPKGKLVRLDVNPEGRENLSFLQRLGPNDIDRLNFSRLGSRVRFAADDELRHVAHLTGLTVLYGRVTDESVQYLRRLPNLKWLYLNNNLELSGDAFAKVCKLPELERLGLRYTRITEEGLKHLPNLKKLRTLSLRNAQVPEGALEWVAQIKGLVSLRLQGLEFTDVDTSPLRSLPNLQYLHVMSTKLTAAAFDDLAQIKTLKLLNFLFSDIDEAGLEHLAQLPNLEHLLFLQNVSDEGLAHLGRIRSLKSLALRSESSKNAITDEGLAHLTRLPHLQHLDLSVWEGLNVTDEGMKHIAKIKTLKGLFLPKSAVTDEGLAILTSLDALETLLLKDTQITPKGWRHLEAFPNLRDLEIVQPDGIPVDLTHLAGLTSLQRLVVSGQEFSRVDTSHLSGLQNLEHLELNGLNLTDESMQPLAALRSLKHLELRYSMEDVTDAGLEPLSHLTNLEYLSISGRLTEKGMGQLSTLRQLSDLVWPYNTVSEEAQERFKAELPNLDYISASALTIINGQRRQVVGDDWDFYTTGFIRKYKLDDAQVTSARSILKETKAARETMMEIGQRQGTAIEARERSYDLLDELMKRLDALLTAEQRGG